MTGNSAGWPRWASIPRFCTEGFRGVCATGLLGLLLGPGAGDAATPRGPHHRLLQQRPLVCGEPVEIHGAVRVRARVHTEALAPGASISLYLELRDGSGAPLRERRFGPTVQRIAHLVTAADRTVVDHRVSADDAVEARVCVYTTHEHGLQLVESLTVQDADARLRRKRSGWAEPVRGSVLR